jgi:hypothetical protein
MTIDLERLAVDADYWDEVAPEGATHFMYSEKFVKWVDGVEWAFYAFSDRVWKEAFCDWSLQDYINRGDGCVLAKPDAPELMPDNCLAARIGEIGNQAHNLACDYQNDENLSEKISKIASGLWDLAKKATIEPAASKPHPTDTQPTDSGAQISAEWENGIPPGGWHGECTWGNKENSHECVILPGLKIAINFYTSWSVDQISQLEGVEFRPIRSQAEREREPVIIAALRAADPPADDEIHPRQYLIDSLNILYDAGMLRMPDEDVAKNARGES